MTGRGEFESVIGGFSYTVPMVRPIDVHKLDLNHFAQDAGVLQGTTPLGQYRRLVAEAWPQADLGEVIWRAHGQWREPVGAPAQVWLHLELKASVPLCCQRCLEQVDVPLDLKLAFRFVATEAQAEAEDEESEEDVLAYSPDFDLHGLIEDELLLGLPLVPKHEKCPKTVQLSAADPDFDAVDADKPHPFAALAAWGGKKP